jgi:seryl-tRNA synthetase
VLDLKLIRDNPEGFDKALKKRGLEPLSDTILALDAERRGAITALQDAQARRNQISKEVGKAKGAKDEALAQKLMAEVGALKDAIASGERHEKLISAKLDDILAGTPNMPADDVPVGDESANKELRKSGKPPKFNYEPKQHFELGEALGLMDFETAAKLSGSRFVVLKGALARMERALANFMLDLHTNSFDYQEVSPPYLVRDETAFGTAQLPKFAEELFSAKYVDFDGISADATKVAKELAKKSREEVARIAIELREQLRDKQDFEVALRAAIEQRIQDDHDETLPKFHQRLNEGEFTEERWLIPTAEVPLTNLVRESILEEGVFPLRFTAHTPCFRAEAGAAGKDTRGMIRLHQFSKVELVSITTPDQSDTEHERMTSCAEEVLKRLGLAYRTVVLASGDMGFSARKTYDIEVWLPGQNAYREISSCSNCGDFQARRMNARYRPKEGKDLRFVHTLNGSALAVGRTLVAIMENYQEKDGSIRIPEVLVPYMGGLEVIEA